MLKRVTTFLQKDEVYDMNGTKLRVARKIGEGAFAFVYEVKLFNTRHKKTSTSFAIKKMICQTEEQLEEATKEIDVLKMCSGHPNIVPMLNSCFGMNKEGQVEVTLLLPLYTKSVQDKIDAGDGYPFCGFDDGLDVVKVRNALQ
jgi:serine/threonine protein kinase